MQFTLNGKVIKYEGDMKLPLLKYLRDVEGIISAKDGCSCQASCGACTVDIDGKATLACVTQMGKVEGKTVTTTDGLEKRIQEAFSKAFLLKGGIQCGFCIPGFVMAARCLLKENQNPTREEVAKAIDKNICRCTGYKKIIDSILFAAKILRGEVKDLDVKFTGKIGERYPKYDCGDKVLGFTPFVADLKFDKMVHGALKFSDHPRAIVKNIDITEALKAPGVERIFTAKDIPGDKVIGLIYKDWPMMIGVGEETHYLGDVLAQVVAQTEAQAREAVKLIKVDYDVLAPVCTPEDAIKPGAPKIGPKGNILSFSELKNGNIEEAFKNAKHIAKATFHTQRIEHAFLETECAVALPWKGPKGNKGIQLHSQSQGAYEDRKQIAQLLSLPEEDVNVIQVANGGGFGGKEDMTVQSHACLSAWHLGKPVKVALTRPESMVMHPKRHPMKLDYELACDEKGTLLGLRARIIGDSGAYASVGMKVLERAAGHSTGPYVVPHMDVEAIGAYTNNVPCGAMRGFGVNQAAFAMEQCIDMLCEMGGFDRFQMRYDNLVDIGRPLSTGQIMGEGTGVRQTLLALKDVFYKNKYVGLACGIKNTGIGNGMPDIGKARIVIKADNKFQIFHGWTEMGQGVHTMAIHFLCEELGVDPAHVEVRVDTSDETVCGMTTSSRGTSLVGHAIVDACKKIKEELKGGKTLKDLVGKSYDGHWQCDFTSKLGYEKEGFGHITHYSYGFASQAVVLDEKTGKISKIYAAHDAGKIMNANLFEGQIEGALHMGLGYAISEDCVYKEGRPEHTHYGRLGIIKAKDMPEVEVIGVECECPNGPHGAKGVGEIGLVPTAAAVANAFYQFDKVRQFSLPMKNRK